MSTLLAAVCVIGTASADGIAPPNLAGCYVDCGTGTHGRTLSHTIAMDTGIDTAEWCFKKCKSLNFTLSGVEASHGCFCGNELAEPANPKVADTQCCAPCAGNETQTCGGTVLFFSILVLYFSRTLLRFFLLYVYRSTK